MPILKHFCEKNFVVIPNKLAQNEKLTYEAKGVLLELLSRPEDWVVHKAQLIRDHTGITMINRIFRELKRAGYVYVHTIRKDGRIRDRVWVVSNEPFEQEAFAEFLKTYNL